MACARGISAVISAVAPLAAATAAQPAVRAAAQQPRAQATALSAVSRRVLADSVHAGSGGSVNMQDYALSDYFAEDYVGVFFLFWEDA